MNKIGCNRAWSIAAGFTALLVIGISAAYVPLKLIRKDNANYKTEVALSGSVRSTILATGQLRALSTVEVGSEISGELSEVLVNFNDKVVKGQVLARINPTRYAAQDASAKASLRSAEANLHRYMVAVRMAKADLERKRFLAEKQLVSESTLEEAEDAHEEASSAVRVAESNIAARRAELSTASYDLQQTSIRSPVDGIVLSRLVEPGQTVAAALQTPTLFKIAEDLGRMLIELSVNEADVGKIKVGNRVVFGVDAYPERNFNGQVQQIRYSPTTNGNVVSYPVIVDVYNSDGALIPGMTANAEIEVARRDDVVRIPEDALLYLPSGGVENFPQPSPKDRRERALSRAATRLRLSQVQEKLFEANLNRPIDLPSSNTGSSDLELVNFFGPEMAAKIVIIDDSISDPAIAGRRTWIKAAQMHFVDFRSSLEKYQKDRWDQDIESIAFGEEAMVVVKSSSKVMQRSIFTGLSDGDHIEVLDGLSEGEVVVISELEQ